MQALSRTTHQIVTLGVVVWALLALAGCKDEKKYGSTGGTGATAAAPAESMGPAARKPKPPDEPDPTDGPILDRDLLEKVALGLTAATTPVVLGPAARDSSAELLGVLTDLLDHSDEVVMWGVFDKAKGVDPENNRAVEVPPLVLARGYLSCFMFPGGHVVRQEGEFGVLEMDAQFRADLPPGDYPHPVWHTEEAWRSYAGANGIVLAFYHGSFVAAYRRVAGAAAPAAPKWDGRWVWADAEGAQPRTARASAVLSARNPYAGMVDAAYQTMEPMLTGQRCFECHVPSNPANAPVLVLLRYPAQAMTAKDALAAVLRENSMPPADLTKGTPEGIADTTARQHLIDAADEWGKLVGEALEWEAQQRNPEGMSKEGAPMGGPLKVEPPQIKRMKPEPERP